MEERTEVWSDDNGPNLISVEVSKNNTVVITYRLLAGLLETAGYFRIDE